MDRFERRRAMLQGRRSLALDPARCALDAAPRARMGRRIREHLRRRETIALLTPRWSAPQAFLESLAAEMAIGEPEVRCRTFSLRPMMGRSVPECWNFLLRVLGELLPPAARRVSMALHRPAFLTAAAELFDALQTSEELPTALLAHGAEHLPFEVLEDLGEVWRAYAAGTGTERRATLLLASALQTPTLRPEEAVCIDLTDFGEREAAAALLQKIGPALRADVAPTAQLSGGIPALVHALGAAELGAGELPRSAEAVLRAAGSVGDELVGAISGVLRVPHLADRLHALADGRPHATEPACDGPLLVAGVLRRHRSPASGQVVLRAPVLAAALG